LQGKLDDNHGVYALILHIACDRMIRIGKLGDQRFKRGYYVYVGSASAPGGLAARVGYHVKKADRPHWHIDYLKEVAEIREVWFSRSKPVMEHVWAGAAQRISGMHTPVKGFGSSDCRCLSHLAYFSRKPNCRLFETYLKRSGYTQQVKAVFCF